MKTNILNNENLMKEINKLFGFDLKEYENLTVLPNLEEKFFSLNEEQKLIEGIFLIKKIKSTSDFLEYSKNADINILKNFKSDIFLLRNILKKIDFKNKRHFEDEIKNQMHNEPNFNTRMNFLNCCDLWLHLLYDQTSQNSIFNTSLLYKDIPQHKITKDKYNDLFFKKISLTLLIDNLKSAEVDLSLIYNLLSFNLKDKEYISAYFLSKNEKLLDKILVDNLDNVGQKNLEMLKTIIEKIKITQVIESDISIKEANLNPKFKI